MEKFELLLEDYNKGEYSKEQFIDPSNCPLSKALKRHLNLKDINVCTSYFIIDNDWFHFVEFQGNEEIEGHLEKLKNGKRVFIEYVDIMQGS